MQPKNSSIHWHFLRNRLFLLTKNALLEKGPKNSGMCRLPPPSFGQCPKENFCFPLRPSLNYAFLGMADFEHLLLSLNFCSCLK